MVLRTMVILLLALLLAAALSGWWVHRDLTTPFLQGSGRDIFVEIPRGAPTAEIAGLLQEAGVLRHRTPFILSLRWSGAARRLKAGDYRFTVPATPSEVAERLVRGDVFYHSVTVPEGLTAAETVALILNSGLGNREELESALQRTDWIRDLDPHAADLEGYLFPDTYRFRRKVSPEEILRVMVERFRGRIAELLAEHPPAPGWDVRGIVTLASLVEKEVGTDAERPLVASVLTNRLAKGMALACDPSIIYAMKLAGTYKGNLSKADLAMVSPYNTYLHPGLPPGPIACPGSESLRAALHPADTDYLYFVSRNDGTHQFSRDFRDHLAAVGRFQKRISP